MVGSTSDAGCDSTSSRIRAPLTCSSLHLMPQLLVRSTAKFGTCANPLVCIQKYAAGQSAILQDTEEEGVQC